MSEARGAGHKDGWDKLKILTPLIGICILLGGGFLADQSLKERDRRLRTVVLAVGILQQDPQKAPKTPVLREWALVVIDKYSVEPLPEKAKQELEEKPLPRAFSRAFSRAFE